MFYIHNRVNINSDSIYPVEVWQKRRQPMKQSESELREATKEEYESVKTYIKRISVKTGVNYYEQEESIRRATYETE